MREGYAVSLWKTIKKGWDTCNCRISLFVGNGRRAKGAFVCFFSVSICINLIKGGLGDGFV